MCMPAATRIFSDLKVLLLTCFTASTMTVIKASRFLAHLLTQTNCFVYIHPVVGAVPAHYFRNDSVLTLCPLSLCPRSLCTRSLCPPVTLSPVTLSPIALSPGHFVIPVTLSLVILSPGHFVHPSLCLPATVLLSRVQKCIQL
jgi:hypothetical protein